MRRRFDSTAEWQAIARGPRPLHHVLTWPDRREEWAEPDFYSTGRADWDDFRRHWAHYWPSLGGRCLEIGCGPGRITHVMAEDFASVVALDVSADMIARASRVVPDNVEFRRVGGPRIPLANDQVDAVFSVHVLQHLDGLPAVASYLSEARRVLVPGGSLMVHTELSGASRSLFGRRGRLHNELRLWQSRRALRLGREHTVVRYEVYRPEVIRDLLNGLGFAQVELRMFPVRSNGYQHYFWFARTP